MIFQRQDSHMRTNRLSNTVIEELPLMEIRNRNAHYNMSTTMQTVGVTYNNYAQYNMASNNLLVR